MSKRFEVVRRHVLVKAVGMCEMGMEQVQFHIIVRPSLLVGEALPAFFADILCSLFQFRRAEEHHAITVNLRHGHIECTVFRLLLQFKSLRSLREHGPDVHLLFQVTDLFEIDVLPFRAVDTPSDGLELLGQPRQREGFYVRHLTPLVTSPPLHHHEPVEGLAAKTVV